jgi:Tfp pilus assembly protein PilF
MDRTERLRILAEKKPEDAFPRYGLAMEYKNQGNHAEAIPLFEQLLEHHPEYIAAYFHFGMSLQAVGQEERAEQVFRQGVDMAERKGELHAKEELQAALAELSGK